MIPTREAVAYSREAAVQMCVARRYDGVIFLNAGMHPPTRWSVATVSGRVFDCINVGLSQSARIEVGGCASHDQTPMTPTVLTEGAVSY